MNEKRKEVNAFLEYYIELPFNLSLPSGLYTLNIQNQIRIRRDLYFLQHGNEIENISTMLKKIESQDKVFNDNGLVDDSLSTFTYKKKMKTVISMRYKIPFYITINESEFYRKIIERELRLKDIKIPEKTLKFFYNRFKNQINEFLLHYVNYFPINDINHLVQYEVRPLSSYELSKLESGINLIFRNIGIQLPPLIEDVGNYFGIPEFTFTNIDKIKEFEKLILNRKKNPILPYQEFFNLARMLYRTNKETMISNIIINIMTSFEAIFHTLEDIDPIFSSFKLIRNPGKGKKRTSVLNFYLNSFKTNNRKKKVTQKAQRKLIKLLRNNNIKIKNSLNSRKILHYLNFSRLIRNQIIHEGKVRYNKEKNRIRFKFKMYKGHPNRTIGINLKVLWDLLLQAYRALNIHILNLKYPHLKWDLPSTYEKTHIATSVTESQGTTVLIVPNYDWRETYSYNMTLPEFAVPPEKFPIGIRTKDEKLINLNLDYQRGKYEVVSQKYVSDNDFFAEWITYDFDFTYEEFKRKHEKKSLNIVINRGEQVYNFRSCINCDFIIPVHRHIEFKNNSCPKCKNKFNLEKYQKDIWVSLTANAFKDEEFEEALRYNEIALYHDKKDKLLWNERGLILLKEDKVEMAKQCIEKSIELDPSFPDPYYNLSCTYSLMKEVQPAITNLKKAIGLNPHFKEQAKTDPDFKNIKDEDEFKGLLK